MMRLKNTPILILLLVLVTGCQVFPYIYGPATPTPDVITDPIALPAQPTVVPTATLEHLDPTTTPVAAEPEKTPTSIPEDSASPTPLPDRYVFQDGSPMALPNFAHPEAACDWMAAAGQVFDSEGNVVIGLTIRIGGPGEVETDQTFAITGQATAYGAGGYEVQIISAPTATRETYWILVMDPEGTTLSEQLFFETFEDCDQNLILINFVPLEAPDAQGAELTPAVTLEAYP